MHNSQTPNGSRPFKLRIQLRISVNGARTIHNQYGDEIGLAYSQWFAELLQTAINERDELLAALKTKDDHLEMLQRQLYVVTHHASYPAEQTEPAADEQADPKEIDPELIQDFGLEGAIERLSGAMPWRRVQP